MNRQCKLYIPKSFKIEMYYSFDQALVCFWCPKKSIAQESGVHISTSLLCSMKYTSWYDYAILI